MKRIFRKIHLWLSVPFGLIISIICFSGAILVFEDEITDMIYSDIRYTDNSGKSPIELDKLLDDVSKTLPDSVHITSVNIYSDNDRAYQMMLSKPRRASIYVDQYTGEIKGKSKRPAFFFTMFKLHRWLLGSANHGGGFSLGKTIVGISTLLFVFVLISGIAIWFPKTKKMLIHSLKISFVSVKKFCHSLHIAGGVYAMIFLLAMSLTGLTWSFGWYRDGFYKLFGAEVKQEPRNESKGQHQRQQGKASIEGNNRKGNSENKGHQGRKEGIQDTPNYVCWDDVYQNLRHQNPDFEKIAISESSANVYFKHFGNQFASDKYKFDEKDGSIKSVSLYRDAERSAKIRGWIYSVHVGNWGGMFSRTISFLVAIIGGTLPLTGYYIWIRRLRKNRK